MVTFWGSKNGPHFRGSKVCFIVCQVTVFLSWAQWLLRAVLSPGRYVIVNLDETAVERVIPRRAGHVAAPRVRGVARPLMHERVARAESHGHLTLVAIATPDAALQPLLPQFILTKDDRLSVAERARLEGMAAPVMWYRGTNGWVTQDNFPSLLTALRRVLRDHRPGLEYVVVLDCAAQHMCGRVIGHAARLGLHLMFVPSRLTYLLQPLDTHVFARFKVELHRLQCAARAEAASGALARCQWLDCLEQAIQNVIVRGQFERAFAGNGLMGQPELVRAAVLDQVGSILPLPWRHPSDDELATLMGRGALREAGRICRPALRLMAAAPAPAGDLVFGAAADVPRAMRLDPPPLPPPLEPPPADDAPIGHRTRSRLHL